jgi:hypothetical protein
MTDPRRDLVAEMRASFERLQMMVATCTRPTRRTGRTPK